MKKITAVILTLVMVLSIVPVVLSAAPEGQGIASIAEITDMAGKYYLTADIAENTTTITEEFTGTLDGNGKSVTTSVALFTSVKDATIQNLTVKGEIKNPTNVGTRKDTDKFKFYGAVTIFAEGKTTFKDLTMEVSFTDDVADSNADIRYGAIAGGTINNGYEFVFENCVTKGTVTAMQYVGGMYGWSTAAGTATFKNCQNTGAVTTSKGYVGGLINRIAPDADADGIDSKLTLINCKNTGAVTTTDQYSGGIVAYHSVVDLEVEGCSNTAAITAKGTAAGIVGKASIDNGNKATFKNCVNDGKIVGGNDQLGGIIGQISGVKQTVEFANCTNNGDIEGPKGYSGGITARVGSDGARNETASSLKVINCVNNGNITSGRAHSAGIVGLDSTYTSEYAFCTNNGDVTEFSEEDKVTTSKSHTAGIVALIGSNPSTTLAMGQKTFKNCTNNGDINSLRNVAGGIVAYIDNLKVNVEFSYVVFENCTNTGDVTSVSHAGGIVAYQYGAGNSYIDVTASVNTGTITSSNTNEVKGTAGVGQIAGYCNSMKNTIKYCIMAGKVVATGSATKALFTTSGAPGEGQTEADCISKIVGNYIVANDGTELMHYQKNDPYNQTALDADATKVAIVTADKLASGEVAYALNQAIGQNTFCQTLGTDAIPTLDDTHKIVVKNDDGTYSNTAAKPSNPTPTGDATLAIFFALMAVSAGAVLTLKKKTR